MSAFSPENTSLNSWYLSRIPASGSVRLALSVGNSAALVVSDMSSVLKLTENNFAPCWQRSLHRPLALTNWILVCGASWWVGFLVGVVFFRGVSIIFVSTQSIHGLWWFSQS